MKHYLEYYKEITFQNWTRPALSDYKGQDFTYSEVTTEILRFHSIFEAIGIQKGDRIALCGKNSARWAMTFLSAETFGAVAVPILYNFTPESVAKLTDHSGSSILFTDSRVLSGFDPSKIDSLQAVISLDDYSCLWSAAPEIAQDIAFASSEYDSLHPAGARPEDFNLEPAPLDSLAIINYTSGTTGEPKGVMLSHRNLSANIEFALGQVPVHTGDTTLAMLPMAHMFGLVFEFFYPLCGGGHVYFLGKAPSPTTLMAAFAEVRPYLFVTVPLVMEKIIKGKVMPTLEKPSMKILTAIPGVRCIVYGQIRKKMMAFLGGNIQCIPMGGAALSPDVEKILHRARLPYTVGYGMTECCPLMGYSPWDKYRQGSCGRELGKYGQVRIDSPDPEHIPGEVQARGDNVMMGYYRNEEATRAAFTDDGWMRSGDLGTMGKDGSIYLRGRLKCMILSANGQNIYPEEIEAVVNSLPEVEESLVVSRKDRLTALVSLKKDADSDVLMSRLDEVNRHLPSYSKIVRFEVMTEPFVHTPKQSIKRALYA